VLVVEGRAITDSAIKKHKDTADIAKATASSTPDSIPLESKVSLKMGVQSKPKNVFAAAKKNALAGKKASVIEQPKKMSEAERIMKEEIERKRSGGASGPGGPTQKKPRF
jgi:DNA/RNA-binding protein KIN17